MERRMFWLLFLVLTTIAQFALPLWWGLLSELPVAVLCWWIVYRSGWF